MFISDIKQWTFLISITQNNYCTSNYMHKTLEHKPDLVTFIVLELRFSMYKIMNGHKSYKSTLRMKNAVFVQRICIHIYAISKTYSGVRSYLDITVNNMQYGNRVCQRCLYSQWWCFFDISCISLHIWSLLQNVDTCNTLSNLPNHRWGKNK